MVNLMRFRRNYSQRTAAAFKLSRSFFWVSTLLIWAFICLTFFSLSKRSYRYCVFFLKLLIELIFYCTILSRFFTTRFASTISCTFSSVLYFSTRVEIIVLTMSFSLFGIRSFIFGCAACVFDNPGNSSFSSFSFFSNYAFIFTLSSFLLA